MLNSEMVSLVSDTHAKFRNVNTTILMITRTTSYYMIHQYLCSANVFNTQLHRPFSRSIKSCVASVFKNVSAFRCCIKPLVKVINLHLVTLKQSLPSLFHCCCYQVLVKLKWLRFQNHAFDVLETS